MVTFMSEATGESEHVVLVSVRAHTDAAPLGRLKRTQSRRCRHSQLVQFRERVLYVVVVVAACLS